MDQKQIILDVRTLEEFEEKSIPGAILANILEPGKFMEVVEKFTAEPMQLDVGPVDKSIYSILNPFAY